MTLRKTSQTPPPNVSLSTIVFSNDSIVKILKKQAPSKLLKLSGLTLLLFVGTSLILVS